MRVLCLTMASWLLIPSLVSATGATKLPSFEQPVRSRDGGFELKFDPKTRLLEVMATGNPQACWAFKSSGWTGTILLADDGKTVVDLTMNSKALSSSRFNKVPPENEVCFQLVTAAGVVKTYRFKDLVADGSKFGMGPGFIFSSWTHWYSDAWIDGGTVVVRTLDGYQYVFDLATGEIIDHETVWHCRVRRLGYVAGIFLAFRLLLLIPDPRSRRFASGLFMRA